MNRPRIAPRIWGPNATLSTAVGALAGLLILLTSPVSAFADTIGPSIEVRLETANGGTDFTFADNKVVRLERWTLLRTKDFASAIARPSRNPNNPGRFEVELTPTKQGALALAKAGAADRTRRYCVLVGAIVDHCAGFPVADHEIYTKTMRLMDRRPAEARKLGSELTAAIAKFAATTETARKAARTSPRALLDLLYRRALKDESPQWFEREERETFLSNALIEVWQKADAAEEAGLEDLIVSADPVAATNGLTLKSYKIAIDTESPDKATASVTLGYDASKEKGMARYELVREGGSWRIADIWSPSSLREALAAFAATSPEPPQP